MAMEMVLRRMKVENVTVHGFGSSFRHWAGNVSSFPHEVVETALADVTGGNAQQAYRRGDEKASQIEGLDRLLRTKATVKRDANAEDNRGRQ
jgi:hypothetical protein